MFSERVIVEQLNSLRDEVANLRRGSEAPAVRERLTAARTYYVRTDGNNSNNGLTNSASGAFATIQKAIQVVAREIDPGGYTVTVQVADGTYNLASHILLEPVFGAESVILQGNTASPASVVLNFTTSNGYGFLLERSGAAVWTVQGFRLIGTTGTTNAAILAQIGILFFGNIEFHSGWMFHLFCDYQAQVQCTGDYAIIPASIGYHIAADAKSHVRIVNRTITLPANLSIGNVWISSGNASLVYFFGNTVTNIGSSTGLRGSAGVNGIINTNGGLNPTLPGNVNVVEQAGGRLV